MKEIHDTVRQDSETHRPKESTHRLCESIVPENSGRRIVVLAAVDNHHHREGQGLERHRRRAEHPQIAHSSPSLLFCYHDAIILPSSFSKCHPWTQKVNGSRNNMIFPHRHDLRNF